MTSESLKIELVGAFPKTIRRACLSAAQDARHRPVAILRTGRHHALLVDAASEVIYVRWRGTRQPLPTWSRDPVLFSVMWRSRTLRAAAILSADPTTAREVIRVSAAPWEGGKTPAGVS